MPSLQPTSQLLRVVEMLFPVRWSLCPAPPLWEVSASGMQLSHVLPLSSWGPWSSSSLHSERSTAGVGLPEVGGGR